MSDNMSFMIYTFPRNLYSQIKPATEINFLLLLSNLCTNFILVC